MADVIGSFSQGFGLGNQVFDTANLAEDREHKLKRQEVLEGRQDTQWQHGLEDREQRLKDNQTVRDRSNIEWDQKQNEYNHQVMLRKRKEGYESIFLPALDKAIVSGDFSGLETPEFNQYIKENPQFDIRHTLSEDTGQALAEGVQMLKKAANSELPEVNDPKLLNSVDKLFPEITKAEGLPKVFTDADGNSYGIKSRSISAVIPSEDGQGFYIQQSLELDNGKTVEVPVTGNRTSAQDDHPRLVPISELTGRMNTVGQMRKQLSQTQLNNWRYLQEGRALDLSGGKKGSGGSGKSSTTGFSNSGDGKGTKFTKEYMSDQQDIEKQIQEQITAVQNDMSLEPDEKQSRISQIEKSGQERLTKNREMWGAYTEVHDPNLEAKQQRLKVNQLVTQTVSMFGEYNFDETDKRQLRKAIESGKDPKQIEKWIVARINSGDIQKRGGGNDVSSEADSIAEEWEKSGTTNGNINTARTEGLSASDIVNRNRLAEENNGGYERNFNSEEFMDNQQSARKPIPQSDRASNLMDYNEKLGLNSF